MSRKFRNIPSASYAGFLPHFISKISRHADSIYKIYAPLSPRDISLMLRAPRRERYAMRCLAGRFCYYEKLSRRSSQYRAVRYRLTTIP